MGLVLRSLHLKTDAKFTLLLLQYKAYSLHCLLIVVNGKKCFNFYLGFLYEVKLEACLQKSLF